MQARLCSCDPVHGRVARQGRSAVALVDPPDLIRLEPRGAYPASSLPATNPLLHLHSNFRAQSNHRCPTSVPTSTALNYHRRQSVSSSFHLGREHTRRGLHWRRSQATFLILRSRSHGHSRLNPSLLSDHFGPCAVGKLPIDFHYCRAIYDFHDSNGAVSNSQPR